MTIKTFDEFIQEAYHSLLAGVPIFINPTKDEIGEIRKTAENGMIRFLSVANLKSIFVWDADKFIHINVLNQLKGKKVIPSDAKLNDFLNYFAGTAKLALGQLIYSGSDELDFYVEQYSKPENQWGWDAEGLANTFFANALKMKQAHTFAYRAIRGLEGDENPFSKIYKLLQASRKQKKGWWNESSLSRGQVEKNDQILQ